MGCNDCPKVTKNSNVDKYGNIKGTETEVEKQEISTNKQIKETRDYPTFEEYLKEKKLRSKKLREEGKNIVETIPEDLKRIRIHELVSTYNHDEVTGMLTPTQALVALYELLQMPPYKKIINEFDNLEEQVIEKYKKLESNKIITKWKK